MVKINFKHVDGKDKGELQLYALSTCGWCRRTRMFLELNEIAYNYVYVDLTEGDERSEVLEELGKYNSAKSFPTLVINNDKAILGYKVEEIADALNLEDYEE